MTDNPWFIRRRLGWCTSIRPAGIKGWLLTGLFAATIEVMALFLNRHDGDYWPVSLVAILGMGLVFATACYRLSAPEERP